MRAWSLPSMILLTIKRQMDRLNRRELKELSGYLIRLRHSTPEWKRATARKIRAVQAGRGVSVESLELDRAGLTGCLRRRSP